MKIITYRADVKSGSSSTMQALVGSATTLSTTINSVAFKSSKMLVRVFSRTLRKRTVVCTEISVCSNVSDDSEENKGH